MKWLRRRCEVCGESTRWASSDRHTVRQSTYVFTIDFISEQAFAVTDEVLVRRGDDVCAACWQRHLDAQRARERAREAEHRQRVARSRTWLEQAPIRTAPITQRDIDEPPSRLREEWLLDIDDLAEECALGWSNYYSERRFRFENMRDPLGSGHRRVLHRYEKNGGFVAIYTGSVFRTENDQLLIIWNCVEYYSED